MEEPKELIFVLGDKLPLIYEAAISITSYAPGRAPTRETKKRSTAVNCYCIALIDLWSKAFGQEHVQMEKLVAQKIRTALKSNYTEVIACTKGTKRERLRRWREKYTTVLNILRATSDPMSFDEDERLFYQNQMSPLRTGFISDQVDDEYVRRQLKDSQRILESFHETAADNETADWIDGGRDTLSEINIPHSLQSQSVNRSGFSRSKASVTEIAVQTENIGFTQPEIRKSKKCSDDIKRACTQVSIACGISLDKSRMAVKIVAKEMYDQR